MKSFFAILFLMLVVCAQATPVYLRSVQPDGTTPQTNAVIVTPWPPNSPFYVYGTNIVAGLGPITNVPDATGFWSNSLAPIIFTVRYANAPTLGYFVKIWDTTNYASIATYVTNVPVANASYGTMFGLVTNWLGYYPATNTPNGILFAEGFQPATNTYLCITNLLGGAPALATYANIVSALGYTPATNTFSGITNSLSYLPATNGGTLTFLQATNALKYVPATNTSAGIIAALTFQPATNNPVYVTNIWVQNVTGITNASGYVTNLAVTLYTNIFRIQAP